MGNTDEIKKPFGPLGLLLLAILVGLVGGLGAVAFRGLIAFFHNLLFLGKVSVIHDATVHTPASPWGPWVILVPVLGAVVVSFLVKNFAPEAKGHGVPEVMDAVFYHKGEIRPVVALIKSLASALSIGSGGSVGREGPIVQIGSSFGSTLGQLIPMPAWQRVTLIACGTGAGIAATFNTLLGGIFFAMEIVMHEISVRTLVPVVLATAAGTYLGRVFFGPSPTFAIPSLATPYFHLMNPWVLISYVGLGLLCGVASAAFIRLLYGVEDFFDRWIGGSYYRRHVLGMLLVGLMMYVLLRTTGHYYVQGVGYATVQDVLGGMVEPVWFLLLLFGLKLLATVLTLGSGASGGIFSPSLFLGATLGGAYGVLMKDIFPGPAISPPGFAVAGMAGVVGGTTGAAMAAMVMILEMTLDYTVIIPLAITVGLSYAVRYAFSRETIYTMKLARRGHYMPPALQASLYQVRRAGNIMDTRWGRLDVSDTLKTAADQVATQVPIGGFLVVDKGRVAGVLPKDSSLESLVRFQVNLSVRDVMNTKYVAVSAEATFYEVNSEMALQEATIALVLHQKDKPVTPGNVAGVITKDQVAEAVIETTRMYWT